MDRYNINLSFDEINIVLTGLGELPAKTVLDLIASIRHQAQMQLAQQAQESEQPPAPKPRRGRKPKAAPVAEEA